MEKIMEMSKEHIACESRFSDMIPKNGSKNNST